MTTLTYKQIQEMIDNNEAPSAEVVWNSAIEAAAKETDLLRDHIGTGLSDRVRKLKQ